MALDTLTPVAPVATHLSPLLDATIGAQFRFNGTAIYQRLVAAGVPMRGVHDWRVMNADQK